MLPFRESARSEHTDVATDAPPPGRKAASILTAARELFIERGFDSVSMDMVARQAPVSKATLYAHFASKDELFTAIVVDEARRIMDEVCDIGSDGADIAAVLRRVAEKFVEIFLSPHTMSLQRAVIGVVPRLPAIGTAIFESGPDILTARLAQFLRESERRGQVHVPNPALAAHQFLSIIRGDLDLRGLLMPGAPVSRSAIAEQIESGIELFLHFYRRPTRQNPAGAAPSDS